MTTTTLSSAGSSSSRQPDYFITASGIPRLASHHPNSKRNMNRNPAIPAGTDPVKLNKCLHNLTVRNRSSAGGRSSSKYESDIVIRNQYSNKSNSSNSGSDKFIKSYATGSTPSVSPASASSSTVIANGLNHSRRNSVTSPCGSSTSFASSSIPRSSHFNHNFGNCNRFNSAFGHGRPPSALLSSRQRRHAAEMADSSSRFDGIDMVRQCRLTVAARKTATSAADNRLNYQRKYDRTIFGYNQMDQFVLPPLQI